MKKLIVAPALLLLLACQDHNPVQPEPEVAPELAFAQAPGGLGSIVKMVPFKGKGSMWFVAGGDESPCLDLPGWTSTSFLESEGTGTQMGRVTSTFTICYGPGAPFVREPLLFLQTMRAANGDLIYGEGRPDDAQAPYQLIVNADFSYEVLNVHVMGGTGRFENATGRWDCFGDDILPLYSFQPVAWTCVGEMSSVGSSK
jgi:hypothetical protein